MDATRRSKGKKQRMLMKIFSAPIKILSKATYLYVKSMENCPNRVSYGAWVGCPSAPPPRLPMSFSVNSFPASDAGEFRQLLRAASKKEKRTTIQTSLLPRSYSVSVGKIGRIDEEKPCAFEEHGIKAKLLYPSRSHAVRRNSVHQQ